MYNDFREIVRIVRSVHCSYKLILQKNHQKELYTYDTPVSEAREVIILSAFIVHLTTNDFFVSWHPQQFYCIAFKVISRIN